MTLNPTLLSIGTVFSLLPVPVVMSASVEIPADTIPDLDGMELQEVVVKADSRKKLNTATNTELITSAELKRAACCSLGESFTTNPSVDVSYSDAATGARQIRLLGLSGTYVQMLTENIPNLRGAASPYGLSYIAGPWMQSIQVSKGASSVKNGYEAVTGQINVEYRKPQTESTLQLNGYLDSKLKAEANAYGNLHFGPKWSSALLVHGEHAFRSHDDNGDGFIDMPAVSQLTAMNRWAYMGENYVFQAGVKLLGERRRSGQMDHHHNSGHDFAEQGQELTEPPLYRIRLDTRRAEFFTKNAYIFDHDNDGNIAAIVSGSFHDLHALYGWKTYDVIQKEFYAQVMFERKWGEIHALSTGISFSYDHFREHLQQRQLPGQTATPMTECEGVSGAYAQYTLTLDSHLIAMAGLRYDYSSIYGSLVTPRFHLRWLPVEGLSANVSIGLGRHTPHALAEYSYLLASSRDLIIASDLRQELALNTGGSVSWTTSLAERPFTISAEYWYTRFRHSLNLNLDASPDAAILTTDNRGARSHTVQAELTTRPWDEFSFTAAWRFNDSKADFGDGKFRERPLMSRSKWLFTGSWEPMMGLWQLDVTLTVNGGGRMPDPKSGLWDARYGGWAQLNAQVTRNFRHWAVYVGGENLTGYKQKHAIINAYDPWGPGFDATMIHGPLDGVMLYAGFRFNI